MRLRILTLVLAAAFGQAVPNVSMGQSNAIVTSAKARLGTELLVSTPSSSILRKRMDSDPQGWLIFHREIKGPDLTLSRDTRPHVLEQKYGHLVHHNGMPVFSAETAGISSEAQLMKQAWADFGALQVYGVPTQSARHSFQVQSLLPSGRVYSYTSVRNQDDLLNKLDSIHQLELDYGPNLKPVLLGLPMEHRRGLASGGHSTNRVWKASREMLSSYNAATLRNKLNEKRFGLFLSHDGQNLLAITVGNNGVTRAEERVNALAPFFVAGSRRF